MDIQRREPRPLADRVVRAVAVGGFCFSLLFIISQIPFNGLNGLIFIYFQWNFVDVLSLLYWVSFLLLFISSTALYFFKEWGRRGFIIAAIAIAVGVTCTEIQQYFYLWHRYSATQPVIVPWWKQLWVNVEGTLSVLLPLGLGIWVLWQPEVIQAVTPTEGRGFAVLPVAERVEEESSPSSGD